MAVAAKAVAEKAQAPVDWATLLVEAVQEPGKIAQAYSMFWNYSLGNQLLALWQCQTRGIEPGPIGAAGHWRNAGRWIRKGERAITLCMPIVYDGWATGVDKNLKPYAVEERIVRFVYRNRWFVLAQTDGEPYEPPPIPDWDAERALAALNITEQRFDEMYGNVMGYTRPPRTIAVSPLSPWPHKTRFHELAHVLLHVGKDDDDGLTALMQKHSDGGLEVEAEAVSYLCCASLGLTDGLEEARGYIQHYLHMAGWDAIQDALARRIFAAAERILKAGRPPKVAADVDNSKD